jgi:hypothetical protein
MRDADDDDERSRVCRAFAELLGGDAEVVRAGSAGEHGRLSQIARRHGVDADGGRLPLDVCSRYGCADAPRRRLAALEHLAADVRTGGQRIMLACACAPRACHAEAWRAAVWERVAQLDGREGAGQGGGAAAECGAVAGSVYAVTEVRAAARLRSTERWRGAAVTVAATRRAAREMTAAATAATQAGVCCPAQGGADGNGSSACIRKRATSGRGAVQRTAGAAKRTRAQRRRESGWRR